MQYRRALTWLRVWADGRMGQGTNWCGQGGVISHYTVMKTYCVVYESSTLSRNLMKCSSFTLGIRWIIPHKLTSLKLHDFLHALRRTQSIARIYSWLLLHYICVALANCKWLLDSGQSVSNVPILALNDMPLAKSTSKSPLIPFLERVQLPSSSYTWTHKLTVVITPPVHACQRSITMKAHKCFHFQVYPGKRVRKTKSCCWWCHRLCSRGEQPGHLQGCSLEHPCDCDWWHS